MGREHFDMQFHEILKFVHLQHFDLIISMKWKILYGNHISLQAYNSGVAWPMGPTWGHADHLVAKYEPHEIILTP